MATISCFLCNSRQRRKKALKKRDAYADVDDYGRLRQSELTFLSRGHPSDLLPPSQQTLITDFALQYRPKFRHQYSSNQLLSVNAMMSRGDSISTTSPSTTTDNCNQIANVADGSDGRGVGGGGDVEDVGGAKNVTTIDYNVANTFSRRPVRTIEDGPTTKQKVLVSFIWIGSVFFGITTCFPDKIFGVELSQNILEDQVRNSSDLITSQTRSIFWVG
jgi:hypothetical protein